MADNGVKLHYMANEWNVLWAVGIFYAKMADKSWLTRHQSGAILITRLNLSADGSMYHCHTAISSCGTLSHGVQLTVHHPSVKEMPDILEPAALPVPKHKKYGSYKACIGGRLQLKKAQQVK